jgi:putative ABC transport system permease protein
VHELGYALRSLARQPVFCVSAIVTLALGIGANTAMFSVFDAVVLHPLPYRDPSRLVLVWQKPRSGDEAAVSGFNYLEWCKRTKSFERLLGVRYLFVGYRGRGESQQLLGAEVSRGFFSGLGLQPALGREFLPGEESSDHNHVAVLSYSLWRREFAGDARALGSAIQMNGEPYTVIGVASPNFDESLALKGIDIWAPLYFDRNSKMHSNTMGVFGRLKPGVTIQEADHEMQTVAGRLASEFPDIDRGWSALVTPLQDYGVGKLRYTIAALLVAVGMVLLIACVNVANLLLARAEVRSKEIAIRAALGASRVRLMRQLLTETMLLALAGGICGVALAYFGIRLLIALKGVELPGLENAARLNGGVLAFTYAVTVFTGILFGLLPARQLLGGDLNQVVRESGRSSINTRRGNGSRKALVISETALSFVLLAGALLMARSLLWLQKENRGFVPDHVLTFSVSLSRSDFPDASSMATYYRALMDRLAALPGVVAAGANTNLPIDGFILTGQRFNLPGSVTPPAERPAAACDAINGSYFRTLGIPLQQGRAFDGHDRDGAPLVAIVSSSLARRFFPGQNPIGRKIMVASLGKSAIEAREIVGVAGDIRYLTHGAAESLEIYLPYAQTTWPNIYVMLRTTRDPGTLAPSVRAALREPGLNRQAMADLRSMEDRIAALNDKPRFNSLLAAAFAAIAVLLAAVGVYGVVSYSASQRAQEIGVRMALGATPRDIVRWIFGQALKLTCAGLAFGLILYFALSPVLASLIYGAGPRDGWSLLAAVIVLGSLALGASYIPARRAVRGDPMAALRSE